MWNTRGGSRIYLKGGCTQVFFAEYQFYKKAARSSGGGGGGGGGRRRRGGGGVAQPLHPSPRSATEHLIIMYTTRTDT